MRLLEIIIAILPAIYLIWPQPRLRAIRYLPAIALLITLIHFVVEGYRWQMIPIYLIIFILAMISLKRLNQISDFKPIGSYLTLGVILITTTLSTLVPVPKIPSPSGDFEIGTRIYEFTDTSRKEIYSGKDEPRRFLIQTWYPADVKSSDKKSPWMENADLYAPAIATYIELPSFSLDHLALVKVPAYKNAEVANNKFPVILFSHGWNGFNAQNTNQMLDLASHGFIVIGMQHTYGAILTAFEDGTVAPNNPAAFYHDTSSPEYEPVARILADQWAGDMSFVLDQLSAWNKEPGNPFYGKLDMSRIGVYGHSTGGGAAVELCGRDSRCNALLGMDAFMRPVSTTVLESGTTQPSFFMFSQEWSDLTDSRNNFLFNKFYANTPQGLGVITIEGTKHYDFTDIPLLSLLAPELQLKGPLDGKRVTEIVNSYLVDFFEMALNDKPSSLFDDKFSTFSEVKVRNK